MSKKYFTAASAWRAMCKAEHEAEPDREEVAELFAEWMRLEKEEERKRDMLEYYDSLKESDCNDEDW